MKRRFLLVLVIALMLASLTGTVGAQSEDAATPDNIPAALSTYLPEGSDIFVGLNTSSTIAENYDGILALLSNVIPDLAGFNTQLLLDLVSFQLTDESFAQGIDPWLGDSVAIAISDIGPFYEVLNDLTAIDPGMTNDPSPSDIMQALGRIPVVFGVEIDDREAADAYFSSGILEPLGNIVPVESVEVPGFDVFAFEGLPILFALGEDAILLFTPAAASDLTFDTPLSADPEFTDTIAQLPASGYTLVAYTDSDDIAAANAEYSMVNLGMILNQPGMDDLPPEITGALFNVFAALNEMSMQTAVGRQALGFAIVDGRSAVIDTVASMPQPGAMDDRSLNPVNPDFAAHIPADAQLVIHDNGFGPETLAIFDALDMLLPAIQDGIDFIVNESGLLDDITIGDGLAMFVNQGEITGEDAEMVLFLLDRYGFSAEDPAIDLLNLIDLSDIALGGAVEIPLNALFGGLTGLSLTDDVLAWMTGDYAMYARLLPVESDLSFTLDAAFLVENTDNDAVQNVMTTLEETLVAYRLGHSVEDMGDGSALVVSAPLPFLLEQADLPREVLDATPELDLVAAADENVYVNASRAAAEFALNPDGDSLADHPDFAYAAETLILPDSVAVWYVGVAPFADALPALLPVASADELEDLAAFGLILESATLSSSVSDTASLLRLSITFQDDYTIPAELSDGVMGEEAMTETEEATADQPPTAEESVEATEEAPEPEMTPEMTEEAPDMEATEEATEIEATEEAPEPEMTPEMTEEAPEPEATEEPGT